MKSFILQDGEEVLLMFRPSKATLLPAIMLSLVLVILPLYYTARFHLFETMAIWLLVWFSLILVWLFSKLFLWRREKYIITSYRLVKTIHESAFRQKVSETPLSRILNVSFSTSGLWSTLARFGDVEVQVVGRLEPIIIKAAPRPGVTKEFLWQLHERALRTAHASMPAFGKPNQAMSDINVEENL